jgi:hypothetical protein
MMFRLRGRLLIVALAVVGLLAGPSPAGAQTGDHVDAVVSGLVGDPGDTPTPCPVPQEWSDPVTGTTAGDLFTETTGESITFENVEIRGVFISEESGTFAGEIVAADIEACSVRWADDEMPLLTYGSIDGGGFHSPSPGTTANCLDGSISDGGSFITLGVQATAAIEINFDVVEPVDATTCANPGHEGGTTVGAKAVLGVVPCRSVAEAASEECEDPVGNNDFVFGAVVS